MPLLIDEEGGLIAGHGRVLAARLLGLEGVPVMVARGWSEAKRRAYIIADNKLALNASWDDAMLAVELSDLQASDFDLNLIGFLVGELAALCAAPTSGLTDPDDVPEPHAIAISRPADLWVLDRHRLICGDSTDAAAVERVLNGVRPHL